VVARLCRFYPGLTPDVVLDMDGAMRSALMLMLPRLQAEEALLGVNVVGIGSATFEQKERAKLWRRLVKAASGPRRARSVVPQSAQQVADRLAAIGLNVVVEERQADGSTREAPTA
jgi:hypothetical protein